LFDFSASYIAVIAKMMAWIRAEAQLTDTDYNKLKVISELLCVQHTSLHEFRRV